MTFFFEVLLLVGFSLASFYIGYRYSIDFNSKQDQPYNSLDDVEQQKPHATASISQAQYQARQKELDKLYVQIKEAKLKEKKTMAQIELLRAKNPKVLSEQEFNNLLDE